MPLSSLGAETSNPKKTIRVIVVDYDPVLATHDGQRLTAYMHWQDPGLLSDLIAEDIGQASGGLVEYQIVDFVRSDSFPLKKDGFRYDEASYLAMWNDRSKAHQPDKISYKSIFYQFDLLRRLRELDAREIWLWGAPYFGFDEYAVKIPGDKIPYPTENPWFYRPYDIPDAGRTIWIMGWSYERDEGDALHSYGHRCEGMLSLTVGKGLWDKKKNPRNIWNRYTHIAKDFPNDAQVGSVHFGPNSKRDYDYADMDTVLSAADDWYNYPFLTGAKLPLNASAWGGPDYGLNYQKWWLGHLPKAPGQTDGFFNNWWRYIVDYDDALKYQPPPNASFQKSIHAMR